MHSLRSSKVFAELHCGMPQGAEIGANTFIDSLDVSDWDLLEIGDEAVIGEGATLMAHSFKDGCLHFDQVLVFCGCSPPLPAAMELRKIIAKVIFNIILHVTAVLPIALSLS